MYHFFRLAGTGVTAAGKEDGPEIADAGFTAKADDGGGVAADGVTDCPEGVGSAGVATLTDELLPESISRFNRFRSPRISDATW